MSRGYDREQKLRNASISGIALTGQRIVGELNFRNPGEVKLDFCPGWESLGGWTIKLHQSCQVSAVQHWHYSRISHWLISLFEMQINADRPRGLVQIDQKCDNSFTHPILRTNFKFGQSVPASKWHWLGLSG